MQNHAHAGYVIISTAKNEEALLHHTLNSVVSQTILPIEYVVVDDGSSDQTSAIIHSYAKKYPWIKYLALPDNGIYGYGAGIISAFFQGMQSLTNSNYDFIVKLDCDLSFAPDYFEQLLERFTQNPTLGIASGQTYFVNKKGKLVWEDAPIDHSFGPAKMYRKKCFDAIGGPITTLGWDHVDDVMARMAGWQTRSYPELPLSHLRMMGSRFGVLQGLKRHGKADFMTGYHPVYFMAKTIYRLFSKPYILGSIASCYGYMSCMFTHTPQVISKEVVQYYRKEQKQKLLQAQFWKLYLKKYGLGK